MSIYEGREMIIKDEDGESVVQELCTIGVQQAVCAFIEDIGRHDTSFKNNDGTPKIRQKIVVVWELAEKMTTGEYAGKPFNISKEYTYSLYKTSGLRADLLSWRGKDFTEEELKGGWNIYNIYGANCQLNIIGKMKKDNTEGRKIATIIPCTKGTPKLFPVATTPPSWVQKKREQSIELKPAEPTAIEPVEDNFDQSPEFGDDDLPF